MFAGLVLFQKHKIFSFKMRGLLMYPKAGVRVKVRGRESAPFCNRSFFPVGLMGSIEFKLEIPGRNA